MFPKVSLGGYSTVLGKRVAEQHPKLGGSTTTAQDNSCGVSGTALTPIM